MDSNIKLSAVILKKCEAGILSCMGVEGVKIYAGGDKWS